jgi:hypothetical protein
MKRWISCMLAIALMLLPVSSFAANFNFGLKDQVVDEAAADAPSTDADDIDLSALTDDELDALINAAYTERYTRDLPSYGKGIDDGAVIVDENGLRIALFDVSYDAEYGHMLRFDALVENNLGVPIGISVMNATADGQEVDGVGIFGIEHGATAPDYFYFTPLDVDADPDHVLENVEVLSFDFGVWNYDTYEDLFEVPVTLNN